MGKEIGFDKNNKAVMKVSKWNYQELNILKGKLQQENPLKNVSVDDVIEYLLERNSTNSPNSTSQFK